MNEREVIARLKRIATAPEARGLADDAALLDGLVISHDSIVEGVHFLPEDPPSSVGWKLVAVNLSDLAAKGATPAGALLSLALAGDGEWDSRFLDGVEAACESYGLPLIGGDTVSLPTGAPRVLGMTAIGRAGERVPDRRDGRPGDELWLVGTLGDSAEGLGQLLRNPRAAGPLVDIYRRPIPLLVAGQALAAHASAMMDVSDGLLLDLQRLCVASDCVASVELGELPLSAAFVGLRGDTSQARLFAATGGDDYALLAALPAGFDPATLSLPAGTRMARIGGLEKGAPEVRLTYLGEAVPLPERLGFEHDSRKHRQPPAAPVADRP